jgi:antitoxin component YwqK of YwqJK toxin-antitoxin module
MVTGKAIMLPELLSQKVKEPVSCLTVYGFFMISQENTTEKISYLLGKRNGYSIKYQKDQVTGLYVHTAELYAGDKREGLTRIFYPDGKLRQTIPYSDGKKDGLSREYDREGKIITLLEYNNDFLISGSRINHQRCLGMKQGEWLDFYPDGSIKNGAEQP